MDCNQIGRAGEFYIAYVLERNGIECHHVNLVGTDLWCQLPNDRMFTVQVKSASAPFQRTDIRRGISYRRGIYSFNLTTTKKADFTIYLALDKELFLVETAEQVGKSSSRQVAPGRFTPEAQAKGIELLKGFLQDNGDKAK